MGLYTHAFVTKKLKAAVAGANGYAGMTAVSLLARHPGVELAQLHLRMAREELHGGHSRVSAGACDGSPELIGHGRMSIQSAA